MRNTSFQKDIKRAVRIVQQLGGKKIILFGSSLRNPKKARDIDFALGGIPEGKFFRVMGQLIKNLDNPIDVVDLDLIDSYMRTRITEEGKILYESKD